MYFFRLCQTENKTPLKRFIRAPDFHQFPQVSIVTTKEVVVSLHSLPHSDLPLDYPMFSWVLADLPSGETPHRKDAKKLPSDFEEMAKDECSYDIMRGKDYSVSPSHVVRKLEFESVRFTGEKSTDKQQCVEKDIGQMSSFETSKNFNRTSTEHSSCSKERQLSEFSANKQASKHLVKEKTNLMSNKKERNTSSETSNQEKNGLSVTKTHFHVSKSLVPQGDAKNNLLDTCPHDNLVSFQRGNCETNELNASSKEGHRTSPCSICDQGVCEIMERLRKDEEVAASRETRSSAFACERTLGCKKMEKQCFENTRDSAIFRTDLNSECCHQRNSRKSLLTRNISAESSKHTSSSKDVLECSHKGKDSSRKVYDNLECKQAYNDRRFGDFERELLERQRSNSDSSNNKACYNLKSSQMLTGNEKRFKNINQVSMDRQRSNSESSEAKCSDGRVKKSWSTDKYGNVLHRPRKGIGDILPEVRHVMDEEYEKTLDERLRKCRLSRESFQPCESKRKTEKTGKREVSYLWPRKRDKHFLEFSSKFNKI